MPDVPHELSPQVGHRREHAARNDIALYLGKPEFDLVEPGGIGRSEVARGRYRARETKSQWLYAGPHRAEIKRRDVGPYAPSWEGMVIENVLGGLLAGAQTSFYRTSAGAEIDLIIEFGAKDRWAIEVKRSIGNPAPSKGFYIGCEDLGAARQIVVYPGTERYKLNPKTEVMPLEVLLREELHRAR